MDQWRKNRRSYINSVTPAFPFGSTSCIRFKGYDLSPHVGTPLKLKQSYSKFMIFKRIRKKRKTDWGLGVKFFKIIRYF